MYQRIPHLLNSFTLYVFICISLLNTSYYHYLQGPLYCTILIFCKQHYMVIIASFVHKHSSLIPQQYTVCLL
ncbi:hypothetical protein XENTR_v10020944 [Xenopus tropicalis]|nr:hypothetical protein XENTR_v10020944 [Xenopus tropicalis]